MIEYFPAQLRIRAVAVLAAYFADTDARTDDLGAPVAAVLAVAAVQADRIDPVTPEKSPLVVVHTPEETGRAPGNGGVPAFKSALTLAIEIRTADADASVAAAARDALVLAVREGLLGSVEFLAKPLESVDGYKVQSALRLADFYIGEALVELTIDATETFPPRLTDELKRVRMDIAPNPIPAPPATPPEPVELVVVLQDVGSVQLPASPHHEAPPDLP